jgi:hypothetical protein
MVFQDGHWYLDPEGEVRAAIVLDNLIHRGDIPVTIGVFVDPGVLEGAEDPKNRNVEYDALEIAEPVGDLLGQPCGAAQRAVVGVDVRVDVVSGRLHRPVVAVGAPVPGLLGVAVTRFASPAVSVGVPAGSGWSRRRRGTTHA